MQHLRISPNSSIVIGSKALTSSLLDGVYKKGTPGKFQFSSFELGATSTLVFPVPMEMDFTVGYLVSIHSNNIMLAAMRMVMQSTHIMGQFVRYFIVSKTIAS